MRKIKFISILLVLSMLLTVPVFAFSLGFTDVPEKAVYAESVSYLAETGILRGTAPSRFAPPTTKTASSYSPAAWPPSPFKSASQSIVSSRTEVLIS